MARVYSSPTLRDWPLEWVELACTKCDRRGRYRKATLLAKYDPNETLPELLHLIAQCPERTVLAPFHPGWSLFK